MWRQIGLIGRDKLLKTHIYPTTQGKNGSFVLSGPRGVGKTAILQWAFSQTNFEKHAFISCQMTIREMFQRIVEQWGISLDGEKEIPINRAKIIDLEKAVNSQEAGIIFIDDIQNATPVFLRRLKVWREKFVIFAAGVPPFKKEELKVCLWGLQEIEIYPIHRDHREELARKIITVYASDKSPREIAEISRGYPARMTAIVKGIIEETSAKVKGEEFDLAPLLLIAICCVVIFRYVGRAVDDSLLVMVGGIGVVFVMFARYFFMSAKKE